MLLEVWIDSVTMWCTLINPDVLFLRSRINLALWVSMDIIAVQQNDCLDDVSTKTLLKAHLCVGCLDDAEQLTQEMYTIGIRANRVTLNELLHARAFASAGAGGRPWSMIPSAASGQERDSFAAAEEDDGFHDFMGPRQLVSSRLNGVENGSFVGKREVRDSEFPLRADGWLHSWFLRGAQLCVVTDRESLELSRPRAARPVGPLIDFMG